jgi:hypothetical protein
VYGKAETRVNVHIRVEMFQVLSQMQLETDTSWRKRHFGKRRTIPNIQVSTIGDTDGLILPRIGGRGKAEDRLFSKEDKDHAKSAKDLHTGV